MGHQRPAVDWQHADCQYCVGWSRAICMALHAPGAHPAEQQPDKRPHFSCHSACAGHHKTQLGVSFAPNDVSQAAAPLQSPQHSKQLPQQLTSCYIRLSPGGPQTLQVAAAAANGRLWHASAEPNRCPTWHRPSRLQPSSTHCAGIWCKWASSCGAEARVAAPLRSHLHRGTPAWGHDRC